MWRTTYNNPSDLHIKAVVAILGAMVHVLLQHIQHLVGELVGVWVHIWLDVGWLYLLYCDLCHLLLYYCNIIKSKIILNTSSEYTAEVVLILIEYNILVLKSFKCPGIIFLNYSKINNIGENFDSSKYNFLMSIAIKLL